MRDYRATLVIGRSGWKDVVAAVQLKKFLVLQLYRDDRWADDLRILNNRIVRQVAGQVQGGPVVLELNKTQWVELVAAVESAVLQGERDKQDVYMLQKVLAKLTEQLDKQGITY